MESLTLKNVKSCFLLLSNCVHFVSVCIKAQKWTHTDTFLRSSLLWLYVCPSVCSSFCLSVCLSFYVLLTVMMIFCLFVSPVIYLSFCLSAVSCYLSFLLSVCCLIVKKKLYKFINKNVNFLNKANFRIMFVDSVAFS